MLQRHARAAAAAAVVALVFASAAGGAVLSPPPPPGFDEESLRGRPVGVIAATGNHRTRSDVVVREVLMRPGDPYEPELARESERNLRTLQYLGSARVRPRFDPSRGVVDLEVAVTERFPWVGGLIPDFGGGKVELDVAAGTGNFLGRGQLVGFRASLSTEVEDSFAVFLSEPRVAGSRWGLRLDLGVQGGVGPRNRIEVYRPLYALSTRWAVGGHVLDEATERVLYADGDEVSNYYRRRRGGALWLVRAFRREDRRLEVALLLDHRDDLHEQAPDGAGVLPQDKRRTTAIASFRAERFRFALERDFQRMGPVEDVKLGPWGGVRAGLEVETRGGTRSHPRLGLDVGWLGGGPERGYLRFDALADGRLESGRLANLVARSSLRGYRRTDARGLLAARVELALLHRMEDPEQLLLDSQNGVRGYRAHAFDGSRRLIAGVEWRRPVLQVGPVATGVAAFVDTGIIWSEQRRFGSAPLLLGVGAGVRLGLARVLGAPVLRLDVGYGTRTRTWEVSGGLGQRF